METKISNIDGKVVIKIIGRLDTTVAVDFSREVAPYYSQKDVNMQLDCTDMDYIASSGLRVFLSTYKSLTANVGSLEFATTGNDGIQHDRFFLLPEYCLVALF